MGTVGGECLDVYCDPGHSARQRLGVTLEVRFNESQPVNDTIALEVFDGTTWTIVTTYSSATVATLGTLTTYSYDVTAQLIR